MSEYNIADVCGDRSRISAENDWYCRQLVNDCTYKQVEILCAKTFGYKTSSYKGCFDGLKGEPWDGTSDSKLNTILKRGIWSFSLKGCDGKKILAKSSQGCIENALRIANKCAPKKPSLPISAKKPKVKKSSPVKIKIFERSDLEREATLKTFKKIFSEMGKEGTRVVIGLKGRATNDEAEKVRTGNSLPLIKLLLDRESASQLLKFNEEWNIPLRIDKAGRLVLPQSFSFRSGAFKPIAD